MIINIFIPAFSRELTFLNLNNLVVIKTVRQSTSQIVSEVIKLDVLLNTEEFKLPDW